MMLSLLILAQVAAAPARSQPAAPQPPAIMPMQQGCCGMPATAQAPWDPAKDYITVGQDEPGYRSWYLAAPWRAAQVKSFNDYLATYQVAGILPTWELFRTATAWKDCGGQPFEIPPTSEWPHIVQTLRYIRDYVVPAVGPVEPVSGYRNPSLNVCAGGAPESAHMHYSALDLVPLRPTTREQLMRTLCDVHARRGADYGVGLGFYAFLRFHVDTTKFRRWNMDPAVAEQCPPILRPSDIASVGQPLPPATATPAPTAAAAPATVAAPAATLRPPPTPERGHSQLQ
jgi:peptidase M15-like protein